MNRFLCEELRAQELYSSEASGARVRKGATRLPLRSSHLTRSARRLFCILILTKEPIHTLKRVGQLDGLSTCLERDHIHQFDALQYLRGRLFESYKRRHKYS